MGISRRQLLGGGAALALGGFFPGPAAAAAPAPGYKVVGWTGDGFELPHKALRDGWNPGPPKVVGKHDVVIVGAGISGLTAAHKLRDTDLRVLELGAQIGGNAQSSQIGGREFNIGSAYFTGVEGDQGQLWDELGLKPVHVDAPTDAWLYRGRWVDNPYGEEVIATLPAGLRQAMGALRKAIVDLLKGKDFPETPYPKASPRALALDRIPFATWLKPYAHPELMAFIDSYCLSAMGDTAAGVSAFGGLNFYSEVVEEVAYAFPEGNHGVVKALLASVEKAGAGRVQRGCMVTRIERAGEDGARVCYVQGGKPLALQARRVVLAVPYFVAARLLQGLSDAQRYALGCQHYASYIVANLVLDGPREARAYDMWTPSVKAVQDVISVDRVERKLGREVAEGQGAIFTCFCPCKGAVMGRYRMIAASAEAHAVPIVKAFEAAFPGSAARLREVHMTRWGHCFIRNRPGMYTRWLPNLDKQLGPVHLAHSDGQGLPAVESSTQEAIRAADWVRGRFRRG